MLYSKDGSLLENMGYWGRTGEEGGGGVGLKFNVTVTHRQAGRVQSHHIPLTSTLAVLAYFPDVVSMTVTLLAL